MYKTIGIEDDDDSSDDSNDEEFVVKESDADESDSASDTTETTSKSARKEIKKFTKGNKGNGNKPVRDGLFKNNQVLKGHSPHVLPTAHPLEKRKVMSNLDRHLSIPRESTTASRPATSPDYKPRKRSSQHLDELELEDDGDADIVNVVPSFASKESFSSWDDFEKHFQLYKRKYNLKFRVRSSEKTENYNKVHEDQMPATFEYTHKIYRCTHGVSQKSRAKGHRNRKQRYCKCMARLTPTVSRLSDNEYGIVIRNQNHTHLHPTTSTQASSYLTTNTLPLDDEAREDVKTMMDARVSSTHITNFLNDRIGCKISPQQTRNLIRSIVG
ncbi:hypothetical protein V7S43_016773 [Phytophthora oleae]